MNQNLSANIWKYYIFKTLHFSIGISIPTLVLFWQDRGLSMTQIMVLQTIFSLILLVLEIPSGYFADLFGRKISLILGGVCFFASFTIYCFSYHFYQFVIAETVIAMGLSLTSGADSALLYDTLKELDREDEYQKIWGNAMFYATTISAGFNILGGFLAAWGLRVPIIATAIMLFFMIPTALSFVEPPRSKIIVKKGYLRELLSIVKLHAISHKQIRSLLFFCAIVVCFYHSVLWLYQPYFKHTGVQLQYYGIIFALYNVFAGIVAKYSYRLERTLGMRLSLLMLMPILMLSSLAMGIWAVSFSFLFTLGHQFVRGFSQVVFSDYLNRLVPSDIRATMISVQSMISRLVYALFLTFIGMVTDKFGVQTSFYYIAISACIAGGVAIFAVWYSGLLQNKSHA
ncbi:MFS transporter [Candidatus Uabimicrobium amorphum]|uniref:MFS transporter n=1 Tax=Uabimicrobium amorphum TaxID=2596890 RepID=A0A5S9IJ89_UABAM|nr:MFS transporter [Candidatus Uabimicrobium amorphum]BBM82070.1 MFS transporter [Candidatus Uabimicrobium amorphum]